MGGELNCMILRDLELFVFTTQRLTRVHVFPFYDKRGYSCKNGQSL